MTDARIISREVLLELANDIYRTAFQAGYEAGQLVACLETPGVTTIEASRHKFMTLKGLRLNESITGADPSGYTEFVQRKGD